ncbi:MAG: hypothetical protein COA79_11860 [Planctomycetota bacterium]|nr:MAG: hypothetical protein COA79_11860 [Planctomycetota bacterium]
MKQFLILIALLLLNLHTTHLKAETTETKKEIKFTKKPMSKKSAAGLEISFEVNAYTDVTITIENEQGKIIRHLVSGMLGKNPPKPLKANSLSQNIIWDGKADFGLPTTGATKVRVALGLGTKFEKVLAEDRQNLGVIIRAVTTDKKGNVYVLSKFGADIVNWSSSTLTMLDRNGKYVKTILPFPAGMKKKDLGNLTTIELKGKTSPIVHNISRRSFYPNFTPPRKGGMAIVDDVILITLGGASYRSKLHIGAIKTDSSIPWKSFEGPKMLKKGALGNIVKRMNTHICVSSDKKWLYFSNVDKSPAVYRIDLPGRSKFEVFFGDEKTAGSGNNQLGDMPSGLALDGKGNLLIADRKNNRILQVKESDASFIKSAPAQSPATIACDSKTGAIYYIQIKKGRYLPFIKLKSIDDPKELGQIPLLQSGHSRYPTRFALDNSDSNNIFWVAGNSYDLIRMEEISSGKFIKKTVTNKNFGTAAFVGVETDKFNDQAYFRFLKTKYIRHNEKNNKTDIVSFGRGGSTGTVIVPGGNNKIYGLAWPGGLYSWDAKGKPIAWKTPKAMPADFAGAKSYKESVYNTFAPVCMVFMTHTLGIRPRDKRTFVFSRNHKKYDRSTKALYEILPSGKVSQTPIIWNASDVVVGPRFDFQGNIYIAEAIKPKDQFVPEEYKKFIGDVKKGTKFPFGSPKNAIANMYSSIIKFSPKGGELEFSKVSYGNAVNPTQWKNTKRDPNHKAQDVLFYKDAYGVFPAKVYGADWIKMGISHLEYFYCNCESTRFDVDAFGRVWYPDLGAYRVVTLDTNGNKIMEFGEYGNKDSITADGKLVTGKIPFAWLAGVGVTDRFAYMGDSMNRRALSVRLTYKAEETCSAK